MLLRNAPPLPGRRTVSRVVRFGRAPLERRLQQGLRYLVPLVLTLIFCVSAGLLGGRLAHLWLLDEAGYGDSYVLYDALQFQKTGTIYRDLSQPPYLAAQYSPLVYILYSLPGRLITSANPFFGPRLLPLAAFVGCAVVVVSISRALLRFRNGWLWSAPLVCTIGSMWPWILQLRGDFFGIFFSLFAVRLLMNWSSWSVAFAGLSAGLAVQFKITFVTALIAGTLWLAVQSRWKDVVGFAALGTFVAICPYLLYWWREPRMLPQMLALSPGLVDVWSELKLIYQVLNEPVLLLSFLGMRPVRLGGRPRWALLMLFAFLSLTLATVIDLNAGGSVNYFFEALFALVPPAVLGLLRITTIAGQRPTVGTFVAALLCVHVLVPRAQELREALINPARTLASRNAAFTSLEQALTGYRILSTVPRLALLDPAPPLTEPYLLSYLQRLGKVDPAPLLERVRQTEFDVAITPATATEWRGIPIVPPDLRVALHDAYAPHCVFQRRLMYLPRRPRPTTAALVKKLAAISCVPVSSTPTDTATTPARDSDRTEN
jgi:hypothetical protein